jgi:HAD superfamily hydrolase (TIGR01484 family)
VLTEVIIAHRTNSLCYTYAMNYKLLLLDIDGTLTASKADALPSPKVVEAVQAAQQKLTVAVATGRSHEFAQPVLDALGLKGYGIFKGGAEIIDITTGKIVSNKLLSLKSLRDMTEIALRFKLVPFTDVDNYAQALTSPDDIQSAAAQFFIAAVPTTVATELLKELSAVPNAIAFATSSWGDGDVVDIHGSHEGATKRHASEKLAASLGFVKEQVIAVGDSHNDVPLLEAAGFKVAMGNAPDEVKAVADYVTASLDDDGVAEVIEKFILA